MKNTSTTKKNS